MLGEGEELRASAASMLTYMLLLPQDMGWRGDSLSNRKGIYSGPPELTLRFIAARLVIPYSRAQKRWDRLRDSGWMDAKPGLVRDTNAPRVNFLQLTDEGYGVARRLLEEYSSKRYFICGKDGEAILPATWDELRTALGKSGLGIPDLFEYWYEVGPWGNNVVDVSAILFHKDERRVQVRKSNLKYTPRYLKPFAWAILQKCRSCVVKEVRVELEELMESHFDAIFNAVLEDSFDSEGIWRGPRPPRGIRGGPAPLLSMAAVNLSCSFISEWLSPSSEAGLADPEAKAIEELRVLDLPERLHSYLVTAMGSMTEDDAFAQLLEAPAE